MTKLDHKRISLAAAAVFGVLVVVPQILYASPADPPAGEADPTVCQDCHDTQAPAMKGTAHDVLAHAIVCTDCHTHTAAHVDDPDTYKPLNPAKLPADSTKAVCTRCHQNPHALNLYERDPHETADLACTACHQVHQHKHAYLLKDEQKDLCLSCHANVRQEFAKTSRHPVMDGVMECMDCHKEVAQSPKQRHPSGPTAVCVTCHGEFQGPFPFEHPAAVDYSTEEGGCMNCHSPHGSQYPRLLTQSYESPHYSLCSQCHSVPKHLNNLKHGTRWAGVPCNECHSDIHGSYTHRNLLDPSLESQGCLKAGCHK
ncbi:MAG TPA: cytochrome c3 family protein [Candidatus Krumholzibacteria bacterium]|nr:cytochrome c3 family protein [Candidatus Krumholzibacteria bacterium]